MSMKVSTMRIVDRLIGVPVCWFLTMCRRTADLFGGSRIASRPSSVIFIKLAEQGATVLAYPAIKTACETVGRSNVYFMVFEENRFVLDLLDVVPRENVIALPTGSLFGLAFGTLRALARVRRLGIEASVDCEFFARSTAILAYLCGCRKRAGFHSFAGEAHYRGDLMTHRLSYNYRLHVTDVYCAMVRALEKDPADLPAMDVEFPPEDMLPPLLKTAPGEVDAFRKTVEEAAGGAGLKPLVLLNSNASDLLPLRRWADDRYVDLARRLLAKSDKVRIAFTGSPSEAVHAEGLVREVGSPRCFSMAGKTTLRELMLLYCIADVLVTNDSGPAHFSTLTPVKTVTLFGPETPGAFGSRNPSNHIVWKKLPCSPCVSAYNDRVSACRNNLCMQKIAVDEVFDIVCRLALSEKTNP